MRFLLYVAILTNSALPLVISAERLPNILWIIAEDLSPFFGCYGDKINDQHTPTVDRLASEGILYTNAYATSPVCSASRSALITGVLQTSTGTHQHRSSRAKEGQVVPLKQRIELPDGIKTIPELFRRAGYYTFNSGKDDYNFHYDRRALYSVGTSASYQAGMNGWQGNRAEHWKSFTKGVWNERKDKNQPWFGQIQIDGGKGDSRYLETAFLSSGRYGVKAALWIPPCKNDAEHKRCFAAAKRYFWETYQIKIDEACKDVSRKCFFSYIITIKIFLARGFSETWSRIRPNQATNSSTVPQALILVWCFGTRLPDNKLVVPSSPVFV